MRASTAAPSSRAHRRHLQRRDWDRNDQTDPLTPTLSRPVSHRGPSTGPVRTSNINRRGNLQSSAARQLIKAQVCSPGAYRETASFHPRVSDVTASSFLTGVPETTALPRPAWRSRGAISPQSEAESRGDAEYDFRSPFAGASEQVSEKVIEFIEEELQNIEAPEKGEKDPLGLRWQVHSEALRRIADSTPSHRGFLLTMRAELNNHLQAMYKETVQGDMAESAMSVHRGFMQQAHVRTSLQQALTARHQSSGVQKRIESYQDQGKVQMADLQVPNADSKGLVETRKFELALCATTRTTLFEESVEQMMALKTREKTISELNQAISKMKKDILDLEEMCRMCMPREEHHAEVEKLSSSLDKKITLIAELEVKATDLAWEEKFCRRDYILARASEAIAASTGGLFQYSFVCMRNNQHQFKRITALAKMALNKTNQSLRDALLGWADNRADEWSDMSAETRKKIKKKKNTKKKR